jgi:hypothetical protein
VFEFIDLDPFTRVIAPLVTNHRAFAQRVYPAGGVGGVGPQLHGPFSAAGNTSTILIRGPIPRTCKDLVTEVERDYLAGLLSPVAAMEWVAGRGDRTRSTSWSTCSARSWSIPTSPWTT